MGAKQVKLLRFLDNQEDREAIDAAFAVYDKDKNGTISRDEFLDFAGDIVTYFIKKHPDDKVGSLAMAPGVSPSLTISKADDKMKAWVARQLGHAMFQVIDANGDGEISLEEWKQTEWKKLLKDIKTHMKNQETRFVYALCVYSHGGRWDIKVSGAMDMEGKLVVKSANDMSGRLGFYSLTSQCRIGGNRIYLHGEKGKDLVEVWLDAVHDSSQRPLPYTFKGALAAKLGAGMPHTMLGEVTASIATTDPARISKPKA